MNRKHVSAQGEKSCWSRPWLLGVLVLGACLLGGGRPALGGGAEGAAEGAAGSGSGATVAAWLTAQTNLQTWTATVRQVRTFKALAQPLEEQGRVWFSAPNRFRWEMGEPARTIAVREPEQMLVIYPRLKRAERFPLSGEAGPWKETLSLLEAGFPRSQAELEARFKVIAVASSNGVCSVRLQPRGASARRMMPELVVAFGEKDFLLRATELKFADGSRLRNEFSGAEVNPSLDAGLFEPKLGADVQVVEPLRSKGR